MELIARQGLPAWRQKKASLFRAATVLRDLHFGVEQLTLDAAEDAGPNVDNEFETRGKKRISSVIYAVKRASSNTATTYS